MDYITLFTAVVRYSMTPAPLGIYNRHLWVSDREQPYNKDSHQPIRVRWAGLRSLQPSRLTGTWDNPVLDVGRCRIDGVRSVSQQLSQCFHSWVFIDTPPPHSPAGTVSRWLSPPGPWNLCGRRRRIIRRLRLIFSPRFSSGKKSELTVTAFCDVNRVKSSSLWQPVTTPEKAPPSVTAGPL